MGSFKKEMLENNKENLIVFKILLKDRTTNEYIKWVTDNYVEYGSRYFQDQEILPECINVYQKFLCPRALKSKESRFKRTKDMAEVFTSSWVCNQQNNLIDNNWFEYEDIFNTPTKNGWITNTNKIKFPKGKTWKNYITSTRLEISCGEAPYLVSLYDAVTGEDIKLIDRIGILDRKLRIVNENVDDRNEWFKWVRKAYEHTYGYELQGDSLLISRINLFNAFIENMEYKFNEMPTLVEKKIIANIISWNIWQMDGTTMTTPYSKGESICQQLSLFDEPKEIGERILSKIFDWDNNCIIDFKSLMNGD